MSGKLTLRISNKRRRRAWNKADERARNTILRTLELLHTQREYEEEYDDDMESVH